MTIMAKQAKANDAPSKVDRQPRVMPDAKRIVNASVASTALATATVMNNRIVLWSITGGYFSALAFGGKASWWGVNLLF